MLSVFLLAAYFLWEKKRERNFLFLLGCVSAANVGYFLLSVAGSLAFAKAANVISYLGSAYAVLAMMFIIADVCQTQWSPVLRRSLMGISTARRPSSLLNISHPYAVRERYTSSSSRGLLMRRYMEP